MKVKAKTDKRQFMTLVLSLPLLNAKYLQMKEIKAKPTIAVDTLRTNVTKPLASAIFEQTV